MDKLSRRELVEELAPIIKASIPKIVEHANVLEDNNIDTWVKTGLFRSEEVSNMEALLNPLHTRHQTLEQLKTSAISHFTDFLLPRLNHISGTDASKLTAHITGEPPAFGGNMGTLIQEKLMMINPLYRDGNLKRGTELEYLGRNFAIEAGYTPRPDLVEQVKQNIKGHPFIGGTPDEIWETNNSDRPQFTLADYKVPNYAKGMVLHDYTMQLHHYLLCTMLGNKQNPGNQVNIHDMALFEVSLSKFNGVVSPVNYNERILFNILEQAELAKNYMTNGVIPDIKIKNDFIPIEATKFIASKVDELNTVSEAKALIDDKEAALKMTITQAITASAPNGKAVMEHKGVVVKTDVHPVFDDTSRSDYATKFDINTDGMTNYKIEQAICKMALETGVDLELQTEQKTKLSFSRKKVEKEAREERQKQLISPINELLKHEVSEEVEFLNEIDEMDTALNDASLQRNAVTKSSLGFQPSTPNPTSTEPTVSKQAEKKKEQPTPLYTM